MADLRNAVPRILVVEDNETTRYLLTRALRQAGYEVIEAKTGMEGIEKAFDRPDLVTLDVNLPDISGVEVCRQIKANPSLRSIPVIHISATFVQGREQAAALNSGADGYLTHPVEDAVLVATVGSYIRARRAEKDREEAFEQAQQALENLRVERELRERFVATLTHDLRTPLTAAKMSAQMVLRQPDLPEKVQRMVNRVKDCIDRSERMIRDLLDANRIRAGGKLPIETEETSLKQIIQLALDSLTSIHGDRFVFRSLHDGKGHWDAAQIQRAIENLASNAVKYGSPYAPITVTLEETRTGVEISVHNEGTPLPETERDMLFEPYRRAHSAEESGQRGWGLGLTVVRGVAEAHGGVASLASSSENGTVFRIVFPAFQGELRLTTSSSA